MGGHIKVERTGNITAGRDTTSSTITGGLSSLLLFVSVGEER
jgi:hypothetical protein